MMGEEMSRLSKLDGWRFAGECAVCRNEALARTLYLRDRGLLTYDFSGGQYEGEARQARQMALERVRSKPQ
jgi:hypothetical protein